jgi:hypothetical protein
LIQAAAWVLVQVRPANKLEVFHGTVGTGNSLNNALALRYNSTTLYGQHYMDGNGFYHIRADAQGVAGGNLILGGDSSVQLWTGTTPEARLTIAATGAATFSGSVALAGSSGGLLLNNSATADNTIQLNTTGGTTFVGANGSAGNRFIGSSAYAATFGTTQANGLELATNNTVRMTISSTGAATFGGAVDVTSTIHPLSLNRTSDTAGQVELKTAGVVRGYWGANSALLLNVTNGAFSSQMTLSTAGALTVAGAATFGGLLTAGTASSQNSVFGTIIGSGGANEGAVIVSSATGKGWLGFNNGNNASIPGQLTYDHATNVLSLYSSGTVSVTGNVGIGGVPEAWSAGFTALEVGGFSLLSTNSNFSSSYIQSNAYYDGAWKYKTTGLASQFVQTSGFSTWSHAVSGTADAALTWVEDMRLDASGNLGLGVVPSAWGTTTVGLDVGSAGSFWGTKSGNTLVAMSDNSYFNGSAYIARSAGAGSKYYQNAGAHYWETAASASAGGVQSNTTLMTLNASGNLLVGNTTSFSAVVRGQFAGASNGIYISSTAAAGTGDNLIAGFHTGSTIAPGTLSFAVATNGNVTNTNNSYGAVSDIKLKENITDATPKLAGINQVRVVNYNLISSPDVKQLGVVAQELEQIFPGMVDETPDRDEDGNDLGTVTKSVKYSVFVPMLIKAMQEQQAIIEALTARLEALEGAN